MHNDILTDEDMQGYEINDPASLISNAFPPQSIVAMGAIGLGALAATILLRSLIPLGAGAFAAIVTGLYLGVANVVFGINFVNNPIVTGFSTLIAIVIGILATLTIVEMFTAQQGAD